MILLLLCARVAVHCIFILKDRELHRNTEAKATKIRIKKEVDEKKTLANILIQLLKPNQACNANITRPETAAAPAFLS